MCVCVLTKKSDFYTKKRHACTKLASNILCSNHSRRKANKKLTLAADFSFVFCFAGCQSDLRMEKHECVHIFWKIFLRFFLLQCVCVVVVFSKQKFLGFFIHFAWSKICILLSHRERVFVILGRGVKSCHILHSFSKKKNTRLVCLVVCGLVSLESVCLFCLSLIVVSLLFWRKPNFTPKARTSRRKS